MYIIKQNEYDLMMISLIKQDGTFVHNYHCTFYITVVDGYMYMYVPTQYMYMYIVYTVHVHVYMYVHNYINVCTYIVHTCIHVYCIHSTYTCIYIVYTIHTCIHVYIYMYLHSSVLATCS